MPELAIKDVAERTGIAAGTIRMWEQRYGFPVPGRTAAGYRRYTESDVELLRKVLALRHRGLSVPAAIERAHDAGGGASDHPSIYAAVASADRGIRPQVLKKSTLVALSRAIEHETLAHAAAPIVFGAFQRERFYRQVEPRYRRMAMHADASAVFADFPAVGRPDGGPVELPIDPQDALGNEWAVVVDAPGYAACLLAWEQPGVTEPGAEGDGERHFEAIWTIDAAATRRATEVSARLAARADPELGERLQELLADRPLALESPAPALTALTTRMVAYLERA
ncbi:MerR family transcriptional regulator [Baekduia soli]|uniref:MerR family transcriptional regulator n=1 Tax=Baekduia soli TaxID=496014 RepID=A0A5B8U3N5_9ACTN|nr:DICT sensory domain-containing protein [Baekduia soli]QEC47669.1 MerR family transcriptional regulator [Baekduia soli]